jgi:Sulfotransferase family
VTVQTLGRAPLRKAANRALGQLYLDRGGDPGSTVFIAGSGRSGTTWLSDIVNFDNRYRHISEPFHRKNVSAAAAFAYRQYLDPDDDDPAYLEPTRQILSGRIRNLWTDKYNRARLPRRRLIKEVRANLFLKWLRVHFPDMPIVLILRHPCAVAASRMKLNWEGGADLATFLDQPRLLARHLSPFEDEIRGAQEGADPYSKMIFFWAIENFIPLRQLSSSEVHLVFYESLVAEPESEVRRLFRYLGMAFDPAALRGMDRPSQATRKDSPVLSGGDLLASWTRRTTERQVDSAMEVLRIFGLHRIYSRDPIPQASAEETLIH